MVYGDIILSWYEKCKHMLNILKSGHIKLNIRLSRLVFDLNIYDALCYNEKREPKSVLFGGATQI